MERIELFAGAVLVALQAGWLVLGAFENIRVPRINAALIEDVVTLRGLRDGYPEVHAQVADNRLTNPTLLRVLFIAIVTAEVIVALTLTGACALLVLAGIGLGDPAVALSVALLGVTGFTAIWGSFLVGGQWFYYWASHEGVQATHFMMTLWGIATLAVLMLIG